MEWVSVGCGGGVTAGASRVWTCNTAVFATRCMRLLSASRPNSLTLKQRAWWRKLACISLRKPREYSWSTPGSPCLFTDPKRTV